MTKEDEREVRRLLLDAAAKVEAATALLDISRSLCQHCKARKLFDRYDEARVRQRIDGVAEKLRVASRRLERSGGGAQVCECQGGRPADSYYNS